jgi:Ca2+-transporting ATPase
MTNGVPPQEQRQDHVAPRAFWLESAPDVLAALGSDAGTGLASTEASARIATAGRNELTATAPVPAWRKFLAQFADILVILLLVASAVSAVLWLVERDTSLPYEALAILAIVILNAVMGYLQEARAERAAAALMSMSAAQANVLRDGERRSVPAAVLVPGDIILVEEGDTVPADARLLEVTSLQATEAALTGESLPVAKTVDALAGDQGIGDRTNMIFSGTLVTYGRWRSPW